MEKADIDKDSASGVTASNTITSIGKVAGAATTVAPMLTSGVVASGRG